MIVRKLFTAVIIFFVALSSLVVWPNARVGAVFNQNNLISDSMFENGGTMMAGDIDTFLNRYSASCISPNHGFSAPDPTGYSPSTGFTYGGDVSAGTVIAHAAQAYSVNPQVILTTIQKEESLVTGDAGCSTLRYVAAMGNGCPDSGGGYNYSGFELYSLNGSPVNSVNGTCVNDSKAVGFSRQVITATWKLKFFEQRSEGNVSWNVQKAGWNNSDDPQTCYSGPMTQGDRKRCSSDASTIYYDGYTTIDNTAVHMDTGATAALYYYTPHFHGNQLFVSTFEDWFGSTQSGSFTIANALHPDGTLIQNFGEPEVYLLINGARYHVPDITTFNSRGYSWSEVRIATIPDKQTTISGSNLSFRGGTLVKGDVAPNVYDLRCMDTFCVKDHIANIETFSGLGLGFIDVITLPQSQVDAIGDGQTVSSSTTHMHDQLVLDNNSGKVYLIDKGSGTKRWVPTLQVFDANHFKWSKVKNATSGDLALADGVNVPFPEGALIRANGDNSVYGVNEYRAINASGTGYEKRHIASSSVFGGLSYHLSDVFVVDSSYLPSATGAEIAE